MTISKFNNWPPDKYGDAYIQGFEHWYKKDNIDRIDKNLNSIFNRIGENKSNCLDIGFGNTFLLRRELKVFTECLGLYIAQVPADEVGINSSIISQGDCYDIPSKVETFNLVSAYALLHIIPSIPEFIDEVYRVLKDGGNLYTDGDKNIYLMKTIRVIKMIQYTISWDKKRFLVWKDRFEKQKDYHSEGIDYRQVRGILEKAGFKKVDITFWFSNNDKLDKKLVFKLFKKFVTTFKFNYLYSHVQIIATK